jgi:hypothetical protein
MKQDGGSSATLLKILILFAIYVLGKLNQNLLFETSSVLTSLLFVNKIFFHQKRSSVDFIR